MILMKILNLLKIIIINIYKPSPIIPKGAYGKWIYEGQVFKCDHPKCIYNIFLIDCSSSMPNTCEKPTNPVYAKK